MNRGTAKGCSSSRLRRVMTVGAVMAMGVIAAGASSCGSDSAAPSGCKAGETRVCVGVGACQGGQTCTADGSWSSCDCGGAGSDGGMDAQLDASVEVEAEASAPAPCEKSGKCPTAGMVEIQWPGGKGSYWIDAYKVKGGEYAVFEQEVTDGYAPPVTDKSCEANKTYVRDTKCVHDGPETDAQIAEAGVYCADYCMARAYCEWVGKRLCKTTVVMEQDGGFASSEDEWANACSNGGQSPNSSDLPRDQCKVFEPPCPDAVPGLYGMEWSWPEWVEVVDTTGKLDPDVASVSGVETSTSSVPASVCHAGTGFLKTGIGTDMLTSFRCCR